MPIFIHVEVSARELEGKLFLALHAVKRGHSVFLGDVISAVERPFFSPGIFHTKGLTPNPRTVLPRHKRIRSQGHLITSIDEEASLTSQNHVKFARSKFSRASIEQASAVFCWGISDYNALLSEYPEHSQRFHLTGNPRVDVWSPVLRQYRATQRTFPQRPFLLFASNIGLPEFSFDQAFQNLRNPNAFHLTKEREHNLIDVWAWKFRMLREFVAAIRFLSMSSLPFDVVLRPHPWESVVTWEKMLNGLPNVHVAHGGSITPWIDDAFALVHNGCSTALQAAVQQTPVITLRTSDGDSIGDKDISFANDLGVTVRSHKELVSTASDFFVQRHKGQLSSRLQRDSQLVASKFANSQHPSAAEKIVDIWDTMLKPDSPSYLKVAVFRIYLLTKSLILRVSGLLDGLSHSPENLTFRKFPRLNMEHVMQDIRSLERFLGMPSGSVRCKKIGERTIILSPEPNRR